ncbi:hypothetical protein A9R05_23080 [Burkholderia sp. KK1]|nr:hypothetical protein A9R05_23080 [Burkholderia sp. KK1]
MLKLVAHWLGRTSIRMPAQTAAPGGQSEPEAARHLDISQIYDGALGVLGAPAPRVQAFTLPQAAPGVIAQDAKLACDSACANVSAPLGSLDRLQAQSLEHMAAVTGIPLIVMLGITPSGLNATSEGELRTFYAWIEAQQEALFIAPLSRLLNARVAKVKKPELVQETTRDASPQTSVPRRVRIITS